MELGRRLMHDGGAALVIDYGHAQTAVGDTLQAVGKHAYADPLSTPGSLDLTAHVDFQALALAVEGMGVNGFGAITQAAISAPSRHRDACGLAQGQGGGPTAAAIDAALKRLIGEGEAGMGNLFKAAAFAHPALGRAARFRELGDAASRLA